MVAHQEKLKVYFQEFPPTRIKKAAAKIGELTGLKRGQTQVCKFLAERGMRCLKVGVVTAKANPDLQEEFQKKAVT